MSVRADPHFLDELSRYGNVNVQSCFNCGNCTAVCPLSSSDENFPRRMIRYAQLGMKDQLVSNKELWMCYNCGECTTTCPRQADPGDFMAATRRYAIARYDRLGLARLLYTSTAFNVVFLIGLAVLLGLFIYSFHGPMPGDSLNLFAFIPAPFIHDLGVIAGIVVILISLWGIATMIAQISRDADVHKVTVSGFLKALVDTLGVEVLGQRRYRLDCESHREKQSWYMQHWFIHASMLWGFLGLFAATALDYLLDLIGVKATGAQVPLWYPTRLLGTLAGMLMIYGVTVAIVNRLRKKDVTSTHSVPSDWSFLVLLWLAGITGFALEMALYLPQPQPWNYWMLLVHLVIVLELLILIPFTKFAHAVYRTVALYFHALKHIPVTGAVGVETAD